MEIYFNIELDSHTNKKGENTIFIRCTFNRQHKRISTGIQIIPKYWNSKQRIVAKNHPLSKEYNSIISQKLIELEKIYLSMVKENQDISLDLLLNRVMKPKSLSFYDFAYKTKLAHFKANKKLGTYRMCCKLPQKLYVLKVDKNV